MYRIATEDHRALIASDSIYQGYSRNDIHSLHEKNLYQLGEDRMLTTLLLKHFADMSLSFVPVACCWTVVPDSFKVLLSQRRRWINSTFHNMWQLMKISIQCGFCCLSMNAIVILDMIFYMILPSGMIYAILYTYTVIADEESINIVTISLYIALIGFQMIIFLVRSRIDYILWFLIYLILGIPVFYFLLPIYSFWNMDDFSWGTTRQVDGAEKENKGSAPVNDLDIAGYGAGEAVMEEEDTNSSSSEADVPPPMAIRVASRTVPPSTTTQSTKSSHESIARSNLGPIDIDDFNDDVELAIPQDVLADCFGGDFAVESPREATFADSHRITARDDEVGNFGGSRNDARCGTARKVSSGGSTTSSLTASTSSSKRSARSPTRPDPPPLQEI